MESKVIINSADVGMHITGIYPYPKLFGKTEVAHSLSSGTALSFSNGRTTNYLI